MTTNTEPDSDASYTSTNQVEFRHPITDERLTTWKDNFTNDQSRNLWWLQYAKGQTYLISPSIFMGDIDDLDFDWYWVIQEQYPQYAFRFYRTYKGFRFFITNVRVSVTWDTLAIHKLFQAFNCDILYQNKVWYNNYFAARLTPKPSRQDESQVTRLIYSNEWKFPDNPNVTGPSNQQRISDAVKVHDSFCGVI